MDRHFTKGVVIIDLQCPVEVTASPRLFGIDETILSLIAFIFLSVYWENEAVVGHGNTFRFQR